MAGAGGSTFGRRVFQARMDLPRPDGNAIAQAEIARLVGRDQQWVSKVERDKIRAVSPEEVQALASALRVDAYELFTGKPYNTALSPWVAKLREYDEAHAIDARGQETILRLAAQQSEQSSLLEINLRGALRALEDPGEPGAAAARDLLERALHGEPAPPREERG